MDKAIEKIPNLFDELINSLGCKNDIFLIKYLKKFEYYEHLLKSNNQYDNFDISIILQTLKNNLSLDPIFSNINKELLHLSNLIHFIYKNTKLKNPSSILILLTRLSNLKSISSIPKFQILEIEQINNQNLLIHKHKFLNTDLIYILQGIDTINVKYNKIEEKFEFINKNELSDPELSLFEKITELGWLYRKLIRYISMNNAKSVTKKYLYEIFNEEISNYYDLIISLESYLNNKNYEISLRRIFILINDPLEKLKYLNILAENIGTSEISAHILNIVFSFQKCGSPLIAQLMKNIFNHILKPLHNFIYVWVNEGIIQDKMEEFFIMEKKNEIENIWSDKFFYNIDALPKFYDITTINKILNSGKTSYFINKFCNLNENSLNNFNVNDKILEIEEFKKFINYISNEIDLRALNIFEKQFNLKMHFMHLKKYFLMEQSEFISFLIENLMEELEKPATQIYKHNLDYLFEQSIKSSNIIYHNIIYSSKLSCKLFESNFGNRGWNVFTLNYNLETPLSFIILKKDRDNYSEIFNLLIRIKHSEICLSKIWENSCFYRKITKNYDIFYDESDYQIYKRISKKSDFVRNEMQQFLTNYLNYLMIEVIEGEWSIFQENLMNSKNIDNVINNHQLFLNNIKKKCFLNSENLNSINKELNLILELINQFKITQKLFCNFLQNDISIINSIKQQNEIKKIMIEDELEFSNSESLLEISNFNKIETYKLNDLFNKIHKISIDINIKIKLFYELIKNESNSNSKNREINLKFNFNEYYFKETNNLIDEDYETELKQILNENNNNKKNHFTPKKLIMEKTNFNPIFSDKKYKISLERSSDLEKMEFESENHESDEDKYVNVFNNDQNSF